MIYLALLCIALLFYSYAGYPVLLAVVARFRARPWKVDKSIRPSVSIILPIYNEQLLLERCLDSLVKLNYPLDSIEILCGSDGSTDRSNAILATYSQKHSIIRPFYFPRQRGKMLVLNDLVTSAKNEILIFVDADVILLDDTILNHVRHYSDPLVGAVAGRLTISGERDDEVFKSESRFLAMEGSMREQEARVYSTVGLYGGNYSIRRWLWRQLPNDRVYDDFFTMLNVLESGTRLLYDREAIAVEYYERDLSDEFSRKTRNATRCLYSMTFFPRTLVWGKTTWMLWGHKTLRYLGGALGAGAVMSGLLAVVFGTPITNPVILFEVIVLGLVLVAALFERAGVELPLLSQLYWLAHLNLAFAIGFAKLILGLDRPLWSQTTRVANQTPGISNKEQFES